MNSLKWWQTAVFYQIYPRSFADGNGDGIGDVQGMLNRLDYLARLGIDAVWLSPHYPSPLIDCGYDVADYTAVAPEYGSLELFETFIDAAHARGIRLILDWVLNHTSSRHPWFLESQSSRHSPKRDWYIWKEGRAGGPPNNWVSTFGGPAWEYDPATDQYYYHFFFKEQPDLNWNNPEVKAAMFDGMRFWLDRGIDGFRLDAIGTLFEAPDLPDHEATLTLPELIVAEHNATDPEALRKFGVEFQAMFHYQIDRHDQIHSLMREMRAVVDEYPDRVLVGETDDIAYLGDGHDELHLVFNFPLMRTERLTPAWILANQQERLSALPKASWPCNTLGNHDTSRVYTHYGDGQHDAALARLSLALMLTLRGTPFLYNGEEIGMTDLILHDLSQCRDTLTPVFYRMGTELFHLPPETALEQAARRGRDKCRTPMQWSRTSNGGFCPDEVTPWLPVNPNYAAGINVDDQEDDPASLLNFYRRLLHLRWQMPALIGGDFQPFLQKSPDLLTFLRHDPENGATSLVALNFSTTPQSATFTLPHAALHRRYSTHPGPKAAETPLKLDLEPFEIYLGDLEPLSPDFA